MVEPAYISNRALNDDSRRFFMSVTVNTPAEGQVLTMILRAPWPATITQVVVQTTVGTCNILVQNGGSTVSFAGDNTDGEIPVATGAPQVFLPDSTTVANFTVAQNDALVLTINDILSGAQDLDIQIEMERTQVDIP